MPSKIKTLQLPFTETLQSVQHGIPNPITFTPAYLTSLKEKYPQLYQQLFLSELGFFQDRNRHSMPYEYQSPNIPSKTVPRQTNSMEVTTKDINAALEEFKTLNPESNLKIQEIINFIFNSFHQKGFYPNNIITIINLLTTGNNLDQNPANFNALNKERTIKFIRVGDEIHVETVELAPVLREVNGEQSFLHYIDAQGNYQKAVYSEDLANSLKTLPISATGRNLITTRNKIIFKMPEEDIEVAYTPSEISYPEPFESLIKKAELVNTKIFRDLQAALKSHPNIDCRNQMNAIFEILRDTIANIENLANPNQTERVTRTIDLINALNTPAFSLTDKIQQLKAYLQTENDPHLQTAIAKIYGYLKLEHFAKDYKDASANNKTKFYEDYKDASANNKTKFYDAAHQKLAKKISAKISSETELTLEAVEKYSEMQLLTQYKNIIETPNSEQEMQLLKNILIDFSPDVQKLSALIENEKVKSQPALVNAAKELQNYCTETLAKKLLQSDYNLTQLATAPELRLIAETNQVVTTCIDDQKNKAEKAKAIFDYQYQKKSWTSAAKKLITMVSHAAGAVIGSIAKLTIPSIKTEGQQFTYTHFQQNIEKELEKQLPPKKVALEAKNPVQKLANNLKKIF